MKHLFLPITTLILLAACSANISGTVNRDQSANIHLYAALEPKMASLLSGPKNQQILDSSTITRSMAKAPGVKTVSFHNRGPAAIEGDLGISEIQTFLALPKTQSGFIHYEKIGSTGGKIAISVNIDTGPKIVSLLSQDAADYLSALMAPVSTGEPLTQAEYLVLVESVYGKGIAEELRGAVIRADIVFPGEITAIRGGTASGNRADFTIPLLDLMVLNPPIQYEVIWK